MSLYLILLTIIVNPIKLRTILSEVTCHLSPKVVKVSLVNISGVIVHEYLLVVSNYIVDICDNSWIIDSPPPASVILVDYIF